MNREETHSRCDECNCLRRNADRRGVILRVRNPELPCVALEEGGRSGHETLLRRRQNRSGEERTCLVRFLDQKQE